ncbi:tRNA lysidine(34) synthetase TilS [Salipaludibacillus daqingensis]|uniref:tRNA lysidine(34) synthetase TilS n=1 Tax=Salipaludibacillus daqingensis TaxID=3041001 RepID=UPI0024745223|nr:tRNA lysidine(34) synthetase TilS [Salipaludibacillus daqingensis]
MKQVINSFMLKHEMLKEGDHLILAVSGGPDSMAMVKFFQDMPSSSFKITVAHVEHGLRGDESKKDAEFVKKYCQSHHIPVYFHQPNVSERKKKNGLSTQEAARLCRYEWFESLMNKLEADKLVLAHHGDDQIETMLMRQIRGSLSGRKGIPVKRQFANGTIIRPFLCVEKATLVRFCETHDVPYRNDPSNKEDDYQRNRLRHHILPYIKQENHKAHEIFQWQSEAWSDDEEWLQSETEIILEKVILEKNADRLSIDGEILRKTPRALQRRVIHLILSYLSKSVQKKMDRHHIESVKTLLVNDHPSVTSHLPDGIVVEKSYDRLEFRNSLFDMQIDAIDTQKIAIPSEVTLPLGKLKVSREVRKNLEEKNIASLSVDLDEVVLPLLVRSRKKGDRMSYVGGEGTKKIKDLFIDQKVPKRDRDVWPIVTDSHDTILWVPFLKRSNEALVNKSSTQVANLTYELYT